MTPFIAHLLPPMSMPRAEIRVYHSSRVRLRGFVLKTTARLKCELTVNT
ncbi:hypothetical protein V1279_007462 [Bradyrhizobium sp. AZCC 1610]